MFKALGTTDVVTTCDCCGKSNLAKTVIVDCDGEILHYGTTCASRNTGKAPKIINAEIRAHEAAQVIAAQNAFRQSPEYLANRARFALRAKSNIAIGNASAEFVRETSDAADQAAEIIAQQFGVESWKIRNI
jgi:spore coat polysaccharide biosynthesis predicted glycosyltransferase SpsG